ncbi:DUF1206 domain-containing protein [Streptomyces sp. t39]|uniref:DUF1206 domain-containing protein n=1 Tax=Streptomyces sp. t39 TaxID=1828156 RepID=UPI0011CE5426|nr:DUF1206 domain-containing protein [Streptomyces sp. t39]TXS57059.1 DUF1206 domain-containing protein [Streptomyces sp. t39]
MNAHVLGNRGTAKARRAANSRAVGIGARWGLAARGVLYVLIGVIALQIAFGDGGEQADRGGALAELAGKPFGSVMLWALGVGLVGMALWRLSEAAFGAAGEDGGKARKRALSGARFVFYAFVAYSVLSFAAGEGGGGSGDQQSKDVTARALELPGGQWIVALAGAGVVVAGVWVGARAVLRKYRKHLKRGSMSRHARRFTDVTGVGGGVARGAVFAVIGVFVARAALEYDPDEAKGFDDALRTFAQTPAGPWLLALIAAGLALFGIFSFAMARWRKV